MQLAMPMILCTGVLMPVLNLLYCIAYFADSCDASLGLLFELLC